MPGPETADATGDPIVITRYLYKPDAGEGNTRFNDNRRLHIFVVDVASGRIDQLTDGTHYEHSIDWSPTGDEIAFVSNREPNEDQFFNYDLFVLKVADKSDPPPDFDGERRVPSALVPRWQDDRVSSDQTRPHRSRDDDGRYARVDDRRGRHEPSRDRPRASTTARVRPNGRAMAGRCCSPSRSAAARISIVCRSRVPAEAAGRRSPGEGGCPAEKVVGDTGSVGAISVAKTVVAYTLATPGDQAELYVAGRKLTDLNADVLRGKRLADVEAFTFVSNDNKFEVEAFLTKPGGCSETAKCPLIVNIHGGPHGQQGPAFNFKNQVYAARGWATLMVNYRGSTGYGQAFTDAVFGDQNGNEGQDVLYGAERGDAAQPVDRSRSPRR